MRRRILCGVVPTDWPRWRRPKCRGCLAAKQRPIIHGLESELLVVLLEQRLDLGERRAGARREHQLHRLVKRDAERSERSSVKSVWLGRPIARLVPRPASSSGLSLPSAQRTASSTSFASRGLSVSVITQIHHSAARAIGSCAKAGMITRAKLRSWSTPPAIVSNT